MEQQHLLQANQLWTVIDYYTGALSAIGQLAGMPEEEKKELRAYLEEKKAAAEQRFKDFKIG